jgi:hypothetical protein
MGRDVYYVVLRQREWKISYNEKHYGPYKTQRDAIKAAVDTAHKAGPKNPHGAQVVVQGEDHQYRTEWTYGNDAYPPKG